MKKFIVLLSAVLLLSGCPGIEDNRYDNRKQIMVEGKFATFDSATQKPDNFAYLIVSKIDQTIFEEKNGLNVLKDYVNPNTYYLIDLYEIFEGEEYHKDFYNLRESSEIEVYSHEPKVRLAYVDDKDNMISPCLESLEDINRYPPYEVRFGMQAYLFIPYD